MKKTLLTLFAGVACAISAYAIPAHKGLVTVNQPDGTPVTIQLIGDEYFHYTTTSDGYTVERNDAGYFVYMQKVNGAMVATNVVAHNAANRTAEETQLLQSLPKHLVADNAASDAKAQRADNEKVLRAKPLGATTKGAEYDYNNFRGLVILVNYNDLSFSREDANAVFTDMITKSGYTGIDGTTPYTGSVRDYFYDNSMGKFDPQFDVYGPVDIDVSKTYAKGIRYANSLIKKVIAAADPIVDFSEYDRDGDGYVDMFYVIFAGFSSSYGGNNSGYLWPHASNNYQSVDGVQTARYACSTEFYGWENYVNSIDGIGTICHEFSHVLGLMDEYDTDYEDGGGQSFDPDQWSVMANGADYNYGRTPASYSALQRMQAGFALPVEITEPGSYTLNVTYETNESYRIKSAVAKESFLFENRSLSTKWDKYLPGEGMMVYRVDSTSTSPWRNNSINCNPSHNYYEVVRARPNTTDMTSSAGDPFPGSGKVTKLTNSTTPANLLSWSGKKTPLVLSGITLDADGVIHFNVGEDYFGSVNEDFEEMTPGEAQSEGKFATWTFNNAKVVTCSSTKGNGAQSVEVAAGGEIIMSTVEAQLIEEIEFAGWNNSMKKSLLTISMSTDEGTTWTEIFARDSSTPTYMSSGVKGVRYAFVADAQGKAMFKISSSGKCYIDDVTISYNDPNGLSDVETIKVAEKAAPFRVATNGNAISVTSDSNDAIEVYDAAGLLVARSASGNATIALPGRGFYIVRQGAASQKVAL